MSTAIQICQPGFDVRNCPDWAYLFNSDWPSLAIAYETTVKPNTGGTTTVTHNLGYVPFVSMWLEDGGKSYGRTNYQGSITTTDFTFSATYASSATIRFYNIDITKEASYPLPLGANAKLPYNDNFGMKIAKNSRAITSTNLNDFVLHTRAQSPAVLQVATQAGQYYTSTAPSGTKWGPGGPTGGPYIVYPYKTTYLPWVFGFKQTSTSPVTYQILNTVELTVVNNQIVFSLQSSTGNTGSLVVLRDPLFYPNTVSVVY